MSSIVGPDVLTFWTLLPCLSWEGKGAPAFERSAPTPPVSPVWENDGTYPSLISMSCGHQVMALSATSHL